MTEDTARKALIACAITAALGTLLPWVDAIIASLSGIQTDRGQVAIGAALVGGLLMLVRMPWWWQAIAPLISGGMAVWLWIDVAAMPRGPFGLTAHPGAGLYVTVGASAAWWLLAMNQRETLRAAARQRQLDHATATPAA